MLGTNEMGPVNSEEFLFCSIALIVSGSIYNFIFSEITKFLRVINSHDMEMMEFNSHCFIVMDYIGLTEDEKNDIMYFFTITESLREMQTDHACFFSLIKPSLILRIQQSVFERNLFLNPVVYLLIDKQEVDLEQES